VPHFVITGKPLRGGDTLLLLFMPLALLFMPLALLFMPLALLFMPLALLFMPLALLFMPLKGKLGTAQPLADFFRRVGRGRILKMFVHFMQVLMLLFYGGHGSLL